MTTENPPDFKQAEFSGSADLRQFIAGLSDMSDETPEQATFRADVILLAEQALRRLPLAKAIEVATYLNSARQIAHNNQYLAQASKMYGRAASLFNSFVNARNRLRYLAGVLGGFTIVFTLLVIILEIARLSERAFKVDGSVSSFATQLDLSSLAPLFIFCGMGTFVSVLTRLSTMDLTDEVDARMLWISGAARPIVAIFLAIVVYVIIRNGFISMHFGSLPSGNSPNDYQPAVAWISSFLSGFSERFATDFIGSLPFPGAQSGGNAPGTAVPKP